MVVVVVSSSPMMSGVGTKAYGLSPSAARRSTTSVLGPNAGIGGSASLRMPRRDRRHEFRQRKEGLRANASSETPPQGAEETEEDFEARLAALKRAKGETPYGESAKRGSSSSKEASDRKPARRVYDYTDETVHFETTPHLGDVAVNVALGATLVWLPLSIAAVGRAAFVKYRFTDKRISCITNAPWKNEQLDAAYQEVKDVVTIGRGIGLWGDMLITLDNGDKIEMRALPRFIEMKEYILKRRDELSAAKRANKASSSDDVERGSGFA